MKKSLFFFLIISLILSCGGSDDGPSPQPPVNPTGMDDDDPTDDQDIETSVMTIDLEGVTNLNFSDVTAISINQQNNINQDGTFEEPKNQDENLPILIIENETILAGYYPKNITNEEVTIDDILFYFFKSYYRIEISSLSDENLMSEIKSLDIYENMKDILISSLNENKSPATNQFFIESIQSFATNSIAESNKTSKITNKVVEDFYFEYARDGRLNWSSNKIPLFANVGFAVRNKGTNQIVFGPELLKTKSLDINASTIIEFLQEQFGEPLPPFSESFQFQEGGEYEIVLTNGTSLVDDLNQAILIRDINDVAALMFTAVFSAGAQTLAGSGDLCNSAMASLFNVNFNFFLNHFIQGTEPSLDEIKTQLLASGTQFLSSVVDCGLNSVALIWFSATIGKALSILNLAFDIYEISSIIRDSPIGLDLNAEETRFFNNGVSFGQLKVTDESVQEFTGIVADDFTFMKVIKEKSTIYEIERGVFSSRFTAEVFEDEGAKDLPFKHEIISGDAVVVNGPIFRTESDGALNFNMTMGNEDSEILLYPDFESTAIDNTTIKLTSLENDLLIIEGNTDFGNVPINQTKEEVFTITNRSDDVMTIDFISTPDGFYSAFSDPNAPLIVIGPQESKTTIIEFKPTIETTYGGTIIISNNVFQENNTISVSGNGIEENNEILDLLLSKTRWSPSVTVRLNQSCSDGTTDQTALNFTNGIFFKEDFSFSWESSYFESQQTGTFSVQGDILTMNGSEAGVIDPQNNEQSNFSFTFVFRYNPDTRVFEGISATYNESGSVLGNSCTWSGGWNGDDSMVLY